VAEGRCHWQQAAALYERALAIIGDDGTIAGEKCDTHAAFAEWLEAEHRAAVVHRGQSPNEQRSMQLYERANKELGGVLEQLDMQPPHPPNKSAAATKVAALKHREALLHSHIASYEQAARRQRDRQLSLASSALRQHAACARCGDGHDHASLFGIVGLWLEYGSELAEAQQELTSLPTHKLLPLITQLACRLGPLSSGDGFQPALRQVLKRVARAHLHVVLPHILALAHGDRFAPGEGIPIIDHGQLEAAKELLKELRREEEGGGGAGGKAASGSGSGDGRGGSSGVGGSVVQATQLLYDFYLQLAWVRKEAIDKLVEATKKRGGAGLLHIKELLADVKERKSTQAHPINFQMRRGAELFRLVQEGRECSAAAVPTCTADGPDRVVHFSHFGPQPRLSGSSSSRGGAMAEAEFFTIGGVNLPKVVFCYAEDGSVHKQLVKGRDDLRGDAVMQQVFGLLNVLLARDDATRQRALRMRTYMVVPLAPTSGVLQWVDDSVTLSSYLTGPNSAHDRYRPNDWAHSKCRKEMAEVHKEVAEKGKPPSARLDTYRRVAENLKPVFHHFFLERWQAPSAWFSRRLAYASSVAAGSMIGFVLGLGDRHSSNILIDTRSAELVHIDLGIAFDQGRLLKTPECVPFRLTRDIEDGLGVSGVDGVLRGAAEHTMRVLRANSVALVTILEVFLRNPLYKWACDPTRDPTRPQAAAAAAANAVPLAPPNGGVPAQQQNREAERALLRIQDKLAGRVAGTNEALAVEGQVRALLDEARDEENLCRLYDGWASWL